LPDGRTVDPVRSGEFPKRAIPRDDWAIRRQQGKASSIDPENSYTKPFDKAAAHRNALLRESGQPVTPFLAEGLRERHAGVRAVE